MADIVLPVGWTGTLPSDVTDEDTIYVTGGILATQRIAFDPSVDDAEFDLTIDKLVDIESGFNVTQDSVSLDPVAEGMYTFSSYVRDGGAYFKVHPSTNANDEIEGVLTTEVGQQAIDVREAIGMQYANMDNQLTAIRNAGVDQSGIRTALGMTAPNNLDDRLDALLLAVNSIPGGGGGGGGMSAAEIRLALGMAFADLDTQLDAIIAAIASGGVTAAQIRAALGIASPNVDIQFDDVLTAVGNVGNGNAGVGSTLFTWYEYEESHENDPLYVVPGVIVTVYANDSATGTPETSAITDETGCARLFLDPGTYYLFRRMAGRSFTNPVTISVG